jgi:imidazolonepropionase-like amidohydrolase
MNKLIRKFALLLLCIFTSGIYADNLLIKNARLYTLSDKGTIDNGYILLKDGLIDRVGETIDFDFDGRVIDATGLSVTPGLVNAYTHLGLTEIDAVSQSLDVSTEDKLFGPSFKIAPAINPASTVIPHNRLHGLTHAIVAPEPGNQVFAGLGAAIRLQDTESIVINENVAMFANFAALGSKLSGGSRAAAYAKIRQSFMDARDYELNKEKIKSGNWREYYLPLYDLEALLPVINTEIPIVVTAHRASDIRLLLKLQKEFKLRLIIAGASEGWLVANELAEAKVPVIIDPMANLPLDFDQLAARLDAATRMHNAGVSLLFTGVSWRNTHSAYLVRQAAGSAARYGMPVTEAIKAMTLNPALAFGFADRFGSIEAGKEADLVIWDGHPLELLTRADRVIMSGKEVPMVSRSTRLRDRYRKLNTLYPPAYQK